MEKSKQSHIQRKEEFVQAHRLEIEQLRHLQSLNIQGLNTKAKLGKFIYFQQQSGKRGFITFFASFYQASHHIVMDP